MIELILIPFIMYGVTVGISVGIVAWKWRDRAAWHRWEIGTLVAPILLWFGLMLANNDGKSFSNLFDEPIVLGLAVAAIACCRIWLAPVLQAKRAAVYLALLALGTSWLVWWAMPGLPE